MLPNLHETTVNESVNIALNHVGPDEHANVAETFRGAAFATRLMPRSAAFFTAMAEEIERRLEKTG